jgi:ketosteroid isomerase-like protein
MRTRYSLLLVATLLPLLAQKLPPLHKQPTPTAVVDEHLDALNKCDWNRLVAQFPENVEIFLPGGVDVIGRQKVGELFRNVVKPVKEGGVCGLKFEKVHSLLVGDTLTIHWRIVGDALQEPYHGTDAYITKNGLMASQVTTFVRPDLKEKK